jgi:amino acid transporter
MLSCGNCAEERALSDLGVSEKRLVGIYALTVVAASIAAFIVGLVSETMFDTEAKGSGMSLVITMCAAMMAGDSYYRRTSAMPLKAFAWKMALKFALVSLGFSLLVLLLLAGSEAVPEMADFLNETVLVAFLFILSFLLLWPTARFGFYWGARSARQRAVRAAAKL